MDGISSSCVDESSTSVDSTSLLIPTPPPPPSTTAKLSSLNRVGSGASSVIIDAELGVEAESRKLPSSRFKGVVPQPNGRWGAQIYEKHQRVWLGTFNDEEEAAKAYDIAAQRFRGRDAVTNLKPIQENENEIAFLNSHSKSEIVDMLRKHTYVDELEQSRRNGINMSSGHCTGPMGLYRGSNNKARDSLFEKTVTPSDVGKLNRLVIPKQHAEKHFPLQSGTTSKGVLLNFEDVGGKVWRFRYSYWNSSQSYVLTKGWSRFVKEKGLKAGDVVSFQRSSGLDNHQLYIDWKVRPSAKGPEVIVTNAVVRLFGVNIFQVPSNTNTSSTTMVGKRLRDVEMLGLECSKKQRGVIVDAL